MSGLAQQGGISAETILTTVEEYKKLNKDIQCLELIYTFIVENQIKQQWSHDFEKLLMITIEIAVKHKKHAMLDETLKIFKEICEKHNFESLFNVFTKYINCLEKAFEDSYKEVQNPEEIFFELKNQNDSQIFFFNSLDTESGQSKEKFKTNWRLLIQGYKNVLNYCFSNRYLLKIYIHFAQKVLLLVQKHQATNFFVLICDFLNEHQLRIIKGGRKITMNLKLFEVNKEFIELRKQQIEIAKELQLNQECFQVLESLNYLLFCKKSLNLQLSYYYVNLAEIFKKGGFLFFHQLALKSNFRILLKLKTDQKILQKEANKLILATLAINTNSEEFFLSSDLIEKYQYLLPNSDLSINLNKIFNSLINENFIDLCSDDIRSLFYACYGKMDIYDFAEHIEKGLEGLSEDLKDYEAYIRENSIQIILQLLSNYYENITFDELMNFTHFENFEKVKKFITKSVFNSGMKIKINQKEQLIEFQSSQMNVSKAMDLYSEYKNNIFKLQKIIERREQMQSQEEKIKLYEEEALEYCNNYEEIQSNFVYLSKIEEEYWQVKRMNKGEIKLTDKEQKRQLQLRKQEEKEQIVEQKMLNEKKIIIASILKIQNEFKLGGKRLCEYTDEEIHQISYDFFFKIKEALKDEKLKRTRKILDKKFDFYDYEQRQKQKTYFENIQKHFSDNAVDFAELEEKQKQIQKQEEETRAQFQSAQKFLLNYQNKKKQEAEDKFEQDLEEFKNKVHDTLYSEILEKIKKKYDEKLKELEKQKKEQQKQNQQMIKGQGFQQTQQSTQMSARGENYQGRPIRQNPQISSQGEIKIAQRGEGRGMIQPQTSLKTPNQMPKIERGTGFKPTIQQQPTPQIKLTRGQVQPKKDLPQKEPIVKKDLPQKETTTSQQKPLQRRRGFGESK